jgi:hypothetical protein
MPPSEYLGKTIDLYQNSGDVREEPSRHAPETIRGRSWRHHPRRHD